MIASRISRLRNQLGWTQLALAKKLHVSLKTVRNWEGGDSYPSAPNIVRLCELFSVTADYLLGIEHDSVISLNGLSEDDKTRLCAMIRVYISLTGNGNG